MSFGFRVSETVCKPEGIRTHHLTADHLSSDHLRIQKLKVCTVEDKIDPFLPAGRPVQIGTFSNFQIS